MARDKTKEKFVIDGNNLYILQAGSKVYMKTADICSIAGYTEQWLSDQVKKGTVNKEKTPQGNLFEIHDTLGTICSLLKDRSEKVSSDEAGADLRKKVADAKYKAAKASKEEILLSELKGKMHRAEDIEQLWNESVYAIRGALLALPGRVAVDANKAGTAAEASEIIKKECLRILKELASYEYDPEKYSELVQEREKMELNWKRFKDGDPDAMDEYF